MLNPSSLILTNLETNSSTLNPQQPANDFFCRFSTPLYLKENSQIALKSIQFESANEIVIDSTCNEITLALSGYVTFPSTTITLIQGTYTIETLCEHISNVVMAALGAIGSQIGFRCYFAAKGFIWFEFVRDESGDYGTALTIQLSCPQPNLCNILGLALNPAGTASQLHTLTDATGPVHNIVADYQPYTNRTSNAYSPLCLVELQNLRIRSMNSYIRNNVNIIAKIPLYSAPLEPYVQYETPDPVYFRTQETTLTELRIRLLNIDMSLHNTTNQKPTIIILEIIPVE